MSDDVVYQGKQFRLRAGSPMPTGGHGSFVLHTFMAEENRVDAVMYTNNLPASSDFLGQGGEYISAQFSRLADRSGDVFQGKIIYKPKIIDEDAIS